MTDEQKKALEEALNGISIAYETVRYLRKGVLDSMDTEQRNKALEVAHRVEAELKASFQQLVTLGQELTKQ